MCKCDNRNIHEAYRKPCNCSNSDPCLEPGQFISRSGPLPLDSFNVGAVIAWVRNEGFYFDPELKINAATLHWLLVSKSQCLKNWVKIRKVS